MNWWDACIEEGSSGVIFKMTVWSALSLHHFFLRTSTFYSHRIKRIEDPLAGYLSDLRTFPLLQTEKQWCMFDMARKQPVLSLTPGKLSAKAAAFCRFYRGKKRRGKKQTVDVIISCERSPGDDKKFFCKVLKKSFLTLKRVQPFLSYCSPCSYTCGELISLLATSECSGKWIPQLGEHSSIVFVQRDVTIFNSTSWEGG